MKPKHYTPEELLAEISRLLDAHTAHVEAGRAKNTMRIECASLDANGEIIGATAFIISVRAA